MINNEKLRQDLFLAFYNIKKYNLGVEKVFLKNELIMI